MPFLDITSTTTSDLTNDLDEFTIDPAQTDGASSTVETEWINENWSQYLGYYEQIPELAVAIDAKATWTVGKGFMADDTTTMILRGIRGWGKDTFNTILENMIRTMMIGGDSYCEIIRVDRELVNLKPLDPGTIKHIVNDKGILIRYEQIDKGNQKKLVNKFQPDELFHISRNRIADEIHGRSIITPIEKIILWRNKSMADWDEALHRNVHPIRLWKIDGDKPDKIAEFKEAVTEAFKKKGEHLFIPKDIVEHEIAAVPPAATMNPLTWIDTLNNYFYQSVGIPAIIVGNSRSLTETSAKMEYLVFQQTVEEDQLFIEEQCLVQLGIVINLEFPVSLENELLSDKRKDTRNGITQPNDTIAGRGK